MKFELDPYNRNISGDIRRQGQPQVAALRVSPVNAPKSENRPRRIKAWLTAAGLGFISAVGQTRRFCHVGGMFSLFITMP